MARYTGPRSKISRRFGELVFILGDFPLKVKRPVFAENAIW